ncbi:MAG: hypothetical protein KA144_14765, partial [Xanthomonadaceae bacterium]|nr:hypothetical protein [Xanthomonadaceae bacterium]
PHDGSRTTDDAIEYPSTLIAPRSRLRDRSRSDSTKTYVEIGLTAIEPISSFRRFSTAGKTPKN